jgi:hypothetical protein
MTTWVGWTPPRMRMWPVGSVAVITELARFWPLEDQLMLELPGHAELAGNTATKPPCSVSVTVRLTTAAVA